MTLIKVKVRGQESVGEQSVTPAMMGTNAVIRGSISYHTA